MLVFFLDSEDKDEVSITTGCRLCKALTKVFDYSILKSNDYKSPDRIHSATALRNLLAICATAKNTALDSKFILVLIKVLFFSIYQNSHSFTISKTFLYEYWKLGKCEVYQALFLLYAECLWCYIV